jgi:hypothetical protein
VCTIEAYDFSFSNLRKLLSHCQAKDNQVYVHPADSHTQILSRPVLAATLLVLSEIFSSRLGYGLLPRILVGLRLNLTISCGRFERSFKTSN